MRVRRLAGAAGTMPNATFVTSEGTFKAKLLEIYDRTVGPGTALGDEALLAAADAGAEDISGEDGVVLVTCEPGSIAPVRAALEESTQRK